MIAGFLAWALAALACLVFFRKALYSLFDPLIIVATVSITFSAALLAVLCTAELVAWDKMILFAVVLLGYLAGARTVCVLFHRDRFRDSIALVLSQVRRREIITILVITGFITLILAILGLQAGAEGDARQRFDKLFRPLVVLDNGLFLVSLVLLLSDKLSSARVTLWLLALVALSIPFSGKSVVIPVVYWYGLKLFLERRRPTARTTALWCLALLAGGTLMELLAYGASNAAAALFMLTRRVWMSGDIYIYAYQANTLEALRHYYHVSFLPYMFHPLTSLFGIRAYDKPLGSMLASELAGQDLLTGPNPQLPVVLDYFFPGQLLTSGVIGFVIGFLVLSLRPLGITLARSRSRFVRVGGIASASMCPAAGFIDTSLVWITFIGIVAATLLTAGLEMLFSAHVRGPDNDISRPPQPVPNPRPLAIEVDVGEVTLLRQAPRT